MGWGVDILAAEKYKEDIVNILVIEFKALEFI